MRALSRHSPPKADLNGLHVLSGAMVARSLLPLAPAAIESTVQSRAGAAAAAGGMGYEYMGHFLYSGVHLYP
jgi:hypothetical protein